METGKILNYLRYKVPFSVFTGSFPSAFLLPDFPKKYTTKIIIAINAINEMIITCFDY